MWLQAVVFHESKLKEKGVIAFRHHSINKQTKKTAVHMADLFYNRKVIYSLLMPPKISQYLAACNASHE